MAKNKRSPKNSSSSLTPLSRQSETEGSRYRLRVLGIITGAVGTATIGCLIFFGDSIATGYYYAELKHRLVAKLESGADAATIRGDYDLKEILPAGNVHVRTVLDFIASLEDADYGSAVSQLGNNFFPKSDAKDHLSENVETLIRMSEESTVNREISNTRDEQTELLQRYAGVKGDLSKLLIFASETEVSESDSDEDGTGEDDSDSDGDDSEGDSSGQLPPESVSAAKDEATEFYQAGLLKGLPVVLGLPDEIADLKGLSAYLKPDFLRVNASNTKVAKSEVGKLIADLKTRTGDLEAELAKNANILAELEDKGREEDSARLQFVQASVQTAHELLLGIAVDRIDPEVRENYTRFFKVASGYGLNLPSLEI